MVDNNGEPLVLYHQTEKEFTTFDTKQKGSGEFDSEMPTGIFMKPTNNDIGVGGNIQMPLYASIKNPLIVNNRSELVKFYDKNVQGYTKAKSAIDSVNKEYKAKFNEEMKRENEKYQKKSTKNPYQEMHLMKLWKNGKIRLMKQAITLKP